jgi:phosphoglycolate phosphatase
MIDERPGRTVRAVFFDLDGTIADTAHDMAFALNELGREEGLAPIPFPSIRPFVSLGSPALLKLAFGHDRDHPDYERRRERFLALYHDTLCARTRLFPGTLEVLSHLDESRIPWGVVTNKPGWLSEPLLAHLGIGGRAACIVSGDTLARRKPHPDQLLYACERTGRHPADCVYVGDAGADVEAAKRAGMRSVVVSFGYVPSGEDPSAWGADAVIPSAIALIAWLAEGG